MIFPPYLSVKIPMGRRKIAPDKMGIPKSQPTSTTLQLNIPLSTRKVTKTPFKVQQAKQIVNANVFRNKILWDCLKLFIVLTIKLKFKYGQNYPVFNNAKLNRSLLQKHDICQSL